MCIYFLSFLPCPGRLTRPDYSGIQTGNSGYKPVFLTLDHGCAHLSIRKQNPVCIRFAGRITLVEKIYQENDHL